MRRLLLPLGLAALLAACAPAPTRPPSSPPTSRLVAGQPQLVLDRVSAVLAAQGFALTPDPMAGTLKASRADADPDWAACPAELVRDPHNDRPRETFQRPESVRTVAVVRAMPLGGDRTQLSLDLLLAGTYHNPYINLTFEEPCPSTGRLEGLILGAAG